MTDQPASSGSERVQTAVTFLNHVLPKSGWRVAYIVQGEKKFNAFFRTNEELATALIRWDDARATVYHACSSFKENKRNTATEKGFGRTQRNVAAVRSLLGDVDAGPGKPYASAVEAARATAAFCKTVDVPLPSVVGSGEGLHVYWTAREDMDPETWRSFAAGFAVLAKKHGFHIDPARTQDLSSVLRTPGTHHRKHGERLVNFSHVAELVTLEQLEPFRVAGEAARIPHMASRPRNGGLSGDLMGGIYDDRPAYADRVADECAQIGAIRKAPGNVSEPVHHAGLGVLHFCIDGRDRAFGWYDVGYHGQVAVKLERAESLTGPTTCEHFRTINPAGCIGCRHSGHIITPLELGRKPALSTPEEPVRIEAVHRPATERETIADPPPDFAYGPHGELNLVIENKNGAQSYELVCQYPIYLKSMQRGETNANAYSCLFRAHTPCDGWCDVLLPAEIVLGRDGTAQLAKNGIAIHHPDAWRRFVRLSMDRFRGKNMAEKRYDKFGWKDDDTTFLVGTRLYTSTGIVPVIGGDSINTRAKYFDFPRRGTFERWQRAANKMFAIGFEHQSIAILAGFAAPLMRFHNTAEGGAILSFISDGSGTGKSSSLEAAASIWGQLEGTKLDDSDTRIAKGLKLGLLSNLPCTYDDLYEHDPEVIRQFIMMFTNGMDKDRATSEGMLRENNASWQTILLLTSNKSMIDTLSTNDGPHASAARILELTTGLPEGTNKGDFDAVRRELAANYGFAGDRYLRELIRPEIINWIKENISGWTVQIRQAAELEEHHRFWVRLAVSIIAAGTIVQRLGILDFSVIRIRDWLIATMRNQRDQIQGSRNTEEATSVLGRFLHDMRNDTLTVDKAYRPGGTVIVERPPTGRLLCRYETDTKRMMITDIELKKWLTKRAISTKKFLETLKEQGVLTAINRKSTLGAGTNFASYQVPCYVVDLSLDAAKPALKLVQ